MIDAAKLSINASTIANRVIAQMNPDEKSSLVEAALNYNYCVIRIFGGHFENDDISIADITGTNIKPVQEHGTVVISAWNVLNCIN